MDKLKSKINEIVIDSWSSVEPFNSNEWTDKILEATKHGVCDDCNLYKNCQSKNEWPMKLDFNDEYQAEPKDQYCSEFEQK